MTSTGGNLKQTKTSLKWQKTVLNGPVSLEVIKMQVLSSEAGIEASLR